MKNKKEDWSGFSNFLTAKFEQVVEKDEINLSKCCGVKLQLQGTHTRPHKLESSNKTMQIFDEWKLACSKCAKLF